MHEAMSPATPLLRNAAQQPLPIKTKKPPCINGREHQTDSAPGAPARQSCTLPCHG